MVRNVYGICEQVSGPLVSSVEKEIQGKTSSMTKLKADIDYLRSLLHQNGINFSL